MLLITRVLKILKYLLKLYSSSTATVCNSKIIVIEMDPPSSLSVSVTASSPISECRSINRHVNFDVYPVLSCPVCHSIQCFKHCDINEERKVWQDVYLQLSYTA